MSVINGTNPHKNGYAALHGRAGTAKGLTIPGLPVILLQWLSRNMHRAAPVLLLDTTACATDSWHDGGDQQMGIASVVVGLTPLQRTGARPGRSFADAGLFQLQARLRQQFCDLSQEPCRYHGRNMQTIHAELDSMRTQIDALEKDLQIRMKRSAVAESSPDSYPFNFAKRTQRACRYRSR